MARPKTGDFSDYAKGYVNAAQGKSVSELIDYHSAAFLAFLNTIPESKANYAYAQGKWTVNCNFGQYRFSHQRSIYSFDLRIQYP